MFRQQKHPGQLGLSDFTVLKRVQITLNGEVFSHILYHYRLAFSGWGFLADNDDYWIIETEIIDMKLAA
jgi:hypothetical protein